MGVVRFGIRSKRIEKYVRKYRIREYPKRPEKGDRGFAKTVRRISRGSGYEASQWDCGTGDGVVIPNKKGER